MCKCREAFSLAVLIGRGLDHTNIDDVLEITTESSKLGKVSGEFKQVIAKKDGTVCAEATVSWACVTTAGRPSKIPENFLVSGLIPEQA